MSLKRITEPTVEPVTLSDMLAFLRVTTTAENALVTSLISTARLMVERFTSRAMLSQQWKLIIPTWCHRQNNNPFSFSYNLLQRIGLFDNYGSIELPRSPLITIDTVQYYDTTNTLQTLAQAGNWIAGPSGEAEHGTLNLVDGAQWPNHANRSDAIQITFTAGYGATADKVPSDLRHAVLFLVSHYYAQREMITVERATVEELPFTFRHLIESYRMDFTA